MLSSPNVATVIGRIARQALLVLLFVAAAVLGTISGALFVYAGDLPQITALDNYAPNTITRIQAADGQIVGEFATERRVVVTYDQIAPRLREAIMASEDAEFDKHFGLSVPRIAIALFTDLVERRKAAGASTLTQQLARNLFLTLEKTWERKVKEALLAIQIEKRYTKPEIFTLYANQIYFGHGAYGVEAAARLYFGKPARAVTLEEAALIAGIIQSPSRQSPYVNMEAALRRRNYALTRMADVGYISQDEATAAKALPIVTTGLPTDVNAVAPFFVEEVRKYLETKYGAKPLYENGLTVRTGLDVDLQRAANRALDHGLRAVDKRRGFRKPARNVAAEGQDVEQVTLPRWARPMEPGDVVPAVVTGVEPPRIHFRAGPLRGTIAKAGFAWTGKTAATALVRAGDVIDVRLEPGDKPEEGLGGTLEQTPTVEGAVLAIENRTGRILAMVGGFSFERSKFNRAVQAFRQLGSTFKPFVYTVAIDRGFTPTSIVLDLPVTYSAGAGQPPVLPRRLRRPVRGSHHAAAGPRAVPQHPGRATHGHAGPETGHLVRQALRLRLGVAPLPVDRARRRRGDPARGDQRLLRVPEPGGAHGPAPGGPDHGPPGQPSRGEPPGPDRRHPGRHRVRPDEPPPGRDPAWHRGQGGRARLAPGRQDRNDQRLHGRMVRRVRPRRDARRLGRLRSEATAGAEGNGRRRGAPHLDGRDEGLDRVQTVTPRLLAARQRRVRQRGPVHGHGR